MGLNVAQLLHFCPPVHDVRRIFLNLMSEYINPQINSSGSFPSSLQEIQTKLYGIFHNMISALTTAPSLPVTFSSGFSAGLLHTLMGIPRYSLCFGKLQLPDFYFKVQISCHLGDTCPHHSPTPPHTWRERVLAFCPSAAS